METTTKQILVGVLFIIVWYQLSIRNFKPFSAVIGIGAVSVWMFWKFFLSNKDEEEVVKLVKPVKTY